jgi:galactose mutarotase-like enzyme
MPLPATIHNTQLRAQIKSAGAELCSLQTANGTELLWQADPQFWGRHAPVLFPIVGRLQDDQLRVAGKQYSMGQHGFARDSEFAIVDQQEHYLSLRLTDSPASRANFPFSFEFLVSYMVDGNRLRTIFTVRNNSAETLPCSLGGHPAFNWPLEPGKPKSSYQIDFSASEADTIGQLQDGLLKTERRKSPLKNQSLMIDEQVFAQDALILDAVNSRRVVYRSNEGGLALQLEFEDFPALGIWKKPEADFICIEPWAGYASPEDFTGEFMDKPGIARLPAYSERSWAFDIRVIEA